MTPTTAHCKSVKINFSNKFGKFSNITSNISSFSNNLKRRFSSGDLATEATEKYGDDEEGQIEGVNSITGHQRRESSGQSPNRGAGRSPQRPQSQMSGQAPPAPPASSSTSGTQPETSKRNFSAPTSPTSSPLRMFGGGPPSAASSQGAKEGFLQRVASITGAAKDFVGVGGSGGVAGAGQMYGDLGAYFTFTGGIGFGQTGINKCPVMTSPPLRKQENTLILLVIDDDNTDWSKYFPKSRRLFDDQVEIQVEQAEFSEISAVSGASLATAVTLQPNNFNGNCIVTLFKKRANGQIVNYSFIPDFVLIRQNLRDAGSDYKNFLIALMYGGLPSVNSLQAIYNFQDKPNVYAQLIGIQRSLIKEAYKNAKQEAKATGQQPIVGTNSFPLIEQIFYPDYKQMASVVPAKLPTVLKIGHAHGGLGKIRAKTLHEFQDASSVVAVTGTYCTAEPYIETRCDAHIQKIGSNYKAFMRKNIVPGSWKSGSGTNTATMLEQIPVSERHKTWVDAVSTIFGGLDICSLEMIVSKDGREFIIEVNDSATTLLGDNQEEDRRHIADLVLCRMQLLCSAPTSQQIQQQIQQQQQQMAQQIAAQQQQRGSFGNIFSQFMGGGQVNQGADLEEFNMSSGGSAGGGGISSVVSGGVSAASAVASAARRRSSGSSGSLSQQQISAAQQPSGASASAAAAASSVTGSIGSVFSSVTSGIKTNPFDTQFMGSASSKMSSLFGGGGSTTTSVDEGGENASKENSSLGGSGSSGSKDKVESSEGGQSKNIDPQASIDGEDTMASLRSTFAGIFKDN